MKKLLWLLAPALLINLAFINGQAAEADELLQFIDFEKEKKDARLDFKKESFIETIDIIKKQHDELYELAKERIKELAANNNVSDYLKKTFQSKVKLAQEHLEEWNKLADRFRDRARKLYEKQKQKIGSFTGKVTTKNNNKVETTPSFGLEEDEVE
jgi:predicted metal-dependent phosphoesterase TrpH